MMRSRLTPRFIALPHSSAPLLSTTCRRHPRAPFRLYSLEAASPTVSDAASKQGKAVLFLSPVWPERSSSAAGVRTADLIDGFKEWGFSVAYSSPAKRNSHADLLEGEGVRVFRCAPNREQDLAGILAQVNPCVCVFDRFYAEEAFSFRVRQLAPGALRVLDMQDVHFLRAGRQRLVTEAAEGEQQVEEEDEGKAGGSGSSSSGNGSSGGAGAGRLATAATSTTATTASSSSLLRDVLLCRPAADSADVLRELASIHRSDLTLVCSPYELHLLGGHYGVLPSHKMALAPFFSPPSPYAPPAARASLPMSSSPPSPSPSAGAAAAVAGLAAAANGDLGGSGLSSSSSGGGGGGSMEALQQQQQQQRAQPCPPFGARRDVLMIGNFRHPPNMDSVEWAVKEVWPLVRERMVATAAAAAAAKAAMVRTSDATSVAAGRTQRGQHGEWEEEDEQLTRSPELHIYGSYAPGSAHRLHDPGAGVHIKGFAPSLDEVMLRYRLCLAPLRFGAGLKGKVVESWWRGMPVVTTQVGAEGMHNHSTNQPHQQQQQRRQQDCRPGLVDDAGTGASCGDEDDGGGGSWGGLCSAESAEQLADDTCRLYLDRQLWERCQARGFDLLQELYPRDRGLAVVRDAVLGALSSLEQRRSVDFTGQLLWQQQFRATEFMSRWIELKEAGNKRQQRQEDEEAGRRSG